ncbi:hypothetical protein [Corynebacterium mayonis]|uniref:hypothetical protein n=1 Tax=Corynebacterium mayonis TaxID=3062461 RepID=UPI003140841B
MLIPARTIVALSTVTVLSLGLAACGSDEEGTSGALSTAARASGAAEASEVNSVGEENKNGADKDGDNDKEAESGEQGGSGAAQTLTNPFAENMTVPNHEPLQGGSPASDADREEIRQTVYNAMNPPSYDQWTRVLLENSCSKIGDPVREEMARSGLTLEQLEQTARTHEANGQAITLPRSEIAVDDVRVDGNRASASVTSTNEYGSDTLTQIFEREDGRWKICK